MRALRLVLPCLAAAAAFGQLTPEQRIQDFQNLTALYAKRYAPYEWKKQALGFDLLDLAPWLERVRAAKDDLEFYEIQAEYVASLNDAHTRATVPSNFTANLGFTVDMYDGKVLVEQINRAMLPSEQYPFAVGDELVSVDGKTVEEWIAAFAKLRSRGNTLSTRRGAADMITYRPQSAVPRASELGDTARVVIRRAAGNDETYTVPWTKSGVPLGFMGPVPPAKSALRRAAAASAEETPYYLQVLAAMRNWSAPPDDPLNEGETWSEELQQFMPRRYLLGYGSRTPAFRAGLPENFVQRLGTWSDFHFSGTYESGGYRIGYLRIPTFTPNVGSAMRELDAEIAYMQENTDGLVVDVMRNPGGNCYMLDVAARLIPAPFYFFGERYRASWGRLSSMIAALDSAKRSNADPSVIQYLENLLAQLKEAYNTGGGMTASIPACTQSGSTQPPTFENLPAATVYTKPMIVLIDEFSMSAADIFPAMIQDNGRAPLVGTRTMGGGGSVESWNTGMYSESTATNTASLVCRKAPVTTPEFPTADYIENIGARADIPLDYMTRDNLLNSGRPFVEGFTQIVVEHIRKSQ